MRVKLEILTETTVGPLRRGYYEVRILLDANSMGQINFTSSTGNV